MNLKDIEKDITVNGRHPDSKFELEYITTIPGYFPGMYHNDFLYYCPYIKSYMVQSVDMDKEFEFNLHSFRNIPAVWIEEIRKYQVAKRTHILVAPVDDTVSSEYNFK